MSTAAQATQQPEVCQFCPHAAHGLEKCSQCKCKGKQGFWKGLLSGLGNAIGESLFGGNR